MNNKIAPIGPLAVVLRRLGAGNRTVVIVAALVCTALLVGVGLLLA
ncbi:hypothetical protein ACIGZJ_35360 [Kitasatospora sp. NPDC052868]